MNKKIAELMKECYVPLVERDGDNVYNMEKFAELIIKECCREIQLECYDFANGDCFRDVALWESVTREYGKNKERGFDPIGMGEHFEQMLKQHFGLE